MDSILSRPAVVIPALLALGYFIYHLLTPSRLPKGLPVIGLRQSDRWFPLLRASWRNTLDFKTALAEADSKYRDQAAILPMAGSIPMIMLPRSETQFVIEQPDTVLDLHSAAIENLQIDYTCTDPYLVYNAVHTKLIVTTLTNQIGNLVPDVADETAWAFDKYWGGAIAAAGHDGADDDAYTEICVYDTLRRVIGHVTNRVFLGTPLCRDTALLDVGMAYAQDVPLMSQVLRLIWEPIRPVAALFLTVPIRLRTRAFQKILQPEIERRLAAFDARQRDPEDKSLSPERNDFLQWSIKQAKESGDPYMWKPATLAGRILLLNFAAIHTSSFSITGAILDLVASKQEYIDELRAEIEGVLAEYGGQWNKRALARMEKLDSVMRESARLNSFVTVGVGRAVVAKEGITTPSGLKIEQGNKVVCHAYSVLQDSEIYPDAQEFKPFRWSQQREDESVEYVKRAAKAFATTSNEYLAFGHGKFACPGRFFAANELKLMLAHLIVNYDLRITEGSRPRNRWFGLNRVPPMKATIGIRRRKRAVS
ncbi:ent-kaurene oxidase [Cercophora scortea]|uniref:Ent-kaurene oxidase n=1 Tax=Cercophora scortea TaxID=314031 RepID=A0AAE0INX2_9PEZI|nr:ent-kaurene oxidase [Cercophora scortea]